MDDQTQPDFSNSVAIANTDAGPAVDTVEQPDFSNSAPAPQPAAAAPRISWISKAAQWLLNQSPVEQFKNALYMQDKWPDPIKNESMFDYGNRAEAVLKPKLDEEAAQGIGKVMEDPMKAGVMVGAVTAPVETALFVGGYSLLDKFVNLRRFTDKHFPQTAPEVKDLIEIADFAMKGGMLGGGIKAGKDFILNRNESLGIPNNANISADQVATIADSPNLLPEEKADMQATLGITPEHVDAARNSGLPINVTADKIIDLSTKPYWNRARDELLGTQESSALPPVLPELKNTEEAITFGKANQGNEPMVNLLRDTYEQNLKNISDIQAKSAKAVEAGDMKASDALDSEGFVLAQKNQLYREAVEGSGNKTNSNLPDIKDLQGAIAQKDLSIATMSKLKKFMNVDNIKNATRSQIEKVTKMVGDLEPGDKFLSEKQTKALDEIITKLSVPEITPKRIVAEKFGEKDDILNDGILSKVMPEGIPAVDIKQGHPIITKIVNNARSLLDHVEKEVSRRNEKFDKMLTEAEKSREKLLPAKERFIRALYPRNQEIFRAMGGEKVELTKEEAGVVAYLRNFFAKAKTDLALEKYRTNYITHMEKPLTEKILDKGLIGGIKDILAGEKPGDVPIDIMLELDNIIGSEKFFKYALERKGGLDPTTNLRRIINGYSNLYETKMALDKILPEGQAVTQTLLKGKSALWMKKFLQNLKGRGMDFQFKNGPMAWLAKVAENIVDLGYIKMLSFNYMSALKNVVAGEANSWLYQDFQTYLTGKQRFYSNPKRAYELAKQFGILDGTYSDYAQKGIGSLKKLQDFSMIGQRIGEIEIRSSIMAAMMTDAEWKAGEISKERINEMKDVVALTQGIFSKVDSPLLLQTWYGRMFFQMNRWRITNALLMRRVVADAAVDIKAGNYKTQNVNRLGKMIVAYGVGMYVANELYKAGFKKAGDVAKNMAQTVDGVASLFTEGDLKKIIKDNPTFQVLGEIFNTIQNTATYLHVPGAKPAKDKGIESTYIAPVTTAEDILKGIENQ